MVAVGNSVPELTTTMLSFMKHGVKMTEFGVASNIGCAVLTITVVPALAILATASSAGSIAMKRKQSGTSSKKELLKQRVMMLTIYRDMGFFILALVLYDVLLFKGVIYFYEACILVSILALYAVSIVMINKYSKGLESQVARGNALKLMREGLHRDKEGEEVVLVQKREVEMNNQFENP